MPGFADCRAGFLIEVLADGVSLGETTADADGLWNFMVPNAARLADGEHVITARAFDQSANPQSISDGLVIFIDQSAPVFSSSPRAAAIDEGSEPGQIIYRATASDQTPIVFSLKADVSDESGKFRIDSDSGHVYLDQNSDFESQSSFSFVVVATDALGNSSELPVSLNLNDLDELPPAPPLSPLLNPQSDSGYSKTDNLTKFVQPTFTGSTEAVVLSISCWRFKSWLHSG